MRVGKSLPETEKERQKKKTKQMDKHSFKGEKNEEKCL